MAGCLPGGAVAGRKPGVPGTVETRVTSTTQVTAGRIRPLTRGKGGCLISAISRDLGSDVRFRAGSTRRRCVHQARERRMRRRKAALVVALATLAALAGGGVSASSQSSDEAAMRPTRTAPNQGVEARVNALLARMTLAEKLPQLQLLSDGQVTDEDAKKGVGGVFSLTDPQKIDHLQHVAVEQSRLHIPILFAYDTIHGYRTVFPVPLGAASSFDPAVAQA